ncbi:MAG: glycosyl hydrolase family 5 [Fibrobacter sp.]|nr:glycosyl hydrolase family 5 [Fibrobacter sp.]
MKSPFLKSLLAAGALLMVCSCGDENPTGSSSTPSNEAIVVDEASFLFEKGGEQYIVAQNGLVTNAKGDTIGAADIAGGRILAMDMTEIATGVDFTQLQVIQPTVITSTAWVMKSDSTNYVIYTDGSVTDASGTPVGIITFQPETTIGTITLLDGSVAVDKIDVMTLKVYESNVKAPEPSSSSVADPTPNEPYVPGEFTPVSSSSQTRSSSSVTMSSSSVAKSSSSVAKSSSSQGGSNGGSYTIKYVNGGASGSGWATRYWDCCKPHCAWPDKGGLKAHACDASGNKINDDGATSMCDGGNAGTCKSQIPIVYNDTIAFAFAAVPGSAGGQCGKCFDLAFTGKGKYATDNHAKLKGKHLIVIASNIGYDVEAGQFDVMIPGGGFGIFDGCSAKMGWGSQGARYGGLLTECEESSGYKASTYKSCLTNKCNSSFSSDPVAKEGCLFLANWMNAAGNPLHNYKEVECPKELLDKF